MICYLYSPATLSILALVLLLLTNLGNGQDSRPIPCPFLVSCEHNQKMLKLPTIPVRLLVSHIDYNERIISLSDPKNCLAGLFLSLNSSSFYPFQPTYYFDYYDGIVENSNNVTFFNCSSLGNHHLRNEFQTYHDGQDMISCPIYIADYGEGIVDLDLIHCIKLFDRVLPVRAYDLRYNSFSLTWSEKSIRIGCFDCNKLKRKITTSTVLVATGIIVGLTVLALAFGAFFRIYRHFRMKGDDVARVEKFLKDYKALKPTRFSFADIKRITHGFKEKLGEGAHGAVYKGKLSNEILVAVKILNNTQGDGKEFINEVGTMGKIHHVNVVRLLGFCADGFHRALVYDFFPNGSLQKFISSPDNRDTFLGWDKLQNIALGIAKGIEYLHQGCDHRILHFDINPHNVLLDDNFTPKISDFGLAKLCSKSRSAVSMTAARGTLGYMAPEVFSRNFGNVSCKSDIYSYGMLVLEMVGGKKNTTTGQENFEVVYPDWIHNLLEGGDIHISIDEEGNFRIAKKLAIVGLWCIQWHPMQRPSMQCVMQMLEGEADKLKVPRNPFESTASTSTSPNAPARCLPLELEVIQELD